MSMLPNRSMLAACERGGFGSSQARGQATWSSIHEKLEAKLNGALCFHGNYHAAPTHAFEKGSDWLVGKGSWGATPVVKF